MAVVKAELERIVAGALQLNNAHVFFAKLQHRLIGAVALYFGAGGVHTQKLRRQRELLAAKMQLQ